MTRVSLRDNPPGVASPGEATPIETTQAVQRLYQLARRQLLANEPLRTHLESAAAFSASEAAALQAVGLSAEPWRGAAQADPTTRAVAGFMALLETSLTTQEVADYLRVDSSRVRQRLRERSLFGIDYDGERRLPRFQFERRGVLPGLRQVLAALPADMNPLDVAQWFLAPHPDLELDGESAALSPRQWLLRGEPVAVVAALARGFE